MIFIEIDRFGRKGLKFQKISILFIKEVLIQFMYYLIIKMDQDFLDRQCSRKLILIIVNEEEKIMCWFPWTGWYSPWDWNPAQPHRRQGQGESKVRKPVVVYYVITVAIGYGLLMMSWSWIILLYVQEEYPFHVTYYIKWVSTSRTDSLSKLTTV